MSRKSTLAVAALVLMCASAGFAQGTARQDTSKKKAAPAAKTAAPAAGKTAPAAKTAPVARTAPVAKATGKKAPAKKVDTTKKKTP